MALPSEGAGTRRPSSSSAAPSSFPSSASARPPDAVATAVDSPKPTDKEWAGAPEAPNAADAQWHPKACSLQQVREWVRVKCGPGYWEPTWLTPDGQLGKDYFTHSEAQVAELIVRTAVGRIQRATIDKPGGHEWLQIAWPTSRPSAAVYLEGGPRGATNLLPRLEPTPIPDVAFEATARPAEADWLAAPEVNTGADNHRAPGCTVRMLSAWVKVYCVRRDTSDFPPDIALVQGFGKVNVDYLRRFGRYRSRRLNFDSSAA